MRNAGDEPIELLEAWLPHGRFRAEAVPLTAQLPLASGASVRLAFTVVFDEPPGELVENAFVILQVRRRNEVWRVLTRLAVTADADGSPLAATELTDGPPCGILAAGVVFRAAQMPLQADAATMGACARKTAT